MCFELYLGTETALTPREWNQANPDLSVKPLSNRNGAISRYFGKPSVQYIGSTSHCGCDFPHLMRQGEDWPAPYDKTMEEAASARVNQEALVSLLRDTGETFVELYGIWSGDFSEPQIREQLELKQLLDPDFYFKEQGFYKVLL